MLTLHSRTITVPRTKLLEALKKNEKIHAKEYKEAMKNYHIALSASLHQAVNIVDTIDYTDYEALRNIKVDFDIPVSHADDYRKTIQMLEFSTAETIEVDESAFQAYINNEWPWKSHFIANSVKYANIAAGFSK